jgi:hypothetical protein
MALVQAGRVGEARQQYGIWVAREKPSNRLAELVGRSIELAERKQMGENE